MQQQELSELIWWVKKSNDECEERSRFLSQYYRVKIITDESATIAEAKGKKPDLVSIDIARQQESQALELVRALRTEMVTKEVPIVLMATEDKEELCIAGLEAGADDYLLEPFSGNELLKCVKSNLKTARLRREAAGREQIERLRADKVQQQLAEILNSMTDAFVAMDREWRITYANYETTKINNISLEEMLGKTCWDVWPYCVGTVLEKEYRRAIGEQIAVHFELFYEPLGKWFEVHAYPFGEGLGVYSRDISDRKIAEQERSRLLAEIEEKQRLLEIVLQQMPAGLILAESPGGRVILKNDKVREILHGFCPHRQGIEEYALGPYRVLDPDGRAYGLENTPLTRSLFTGEIVKEEEIHLVFPDGTSNIVQVDSAPIRNATGSIVAGIFIFHDITKRKQAEKLLQETEERLRLALSSAQTIAWDMNIKTRWVVCTENALAAWGIKESTLEDFFAVIHSVDRQSVIQATKRAMAGEESYQSEYRVINPQGNIRWLHSKGKVHFDTNGQPERMVGVSVDITERVKVAEALAESEERLKIALQTGRLGAWQLDLLSGTIDCSELCKANLGFPPEEELSYEKFLNAIYWEDRDCVKEGMQRALAEKLDYDLEYRVVWADSSIHWVIARGRGIYNADGISYRMVGAILDITDRKRVEQERERLLANEREARACAETANRIKDEFLAVLSHELRSPLNPILGWAQLLRGNKKYDEAIFEKGLETIERNIKIQIQLIDDLLDVARILQGKLLLDMTLVDPVDSVNAAIDTVRLAASSKSIQIETKIESKVGKINADAGRLQQIFGNLLSNAIKFTSPGGRVSVCVEQVEKEVRVRVSDTGKGISPDFLPHVFEQFRQADNSTTRHYGGLGLGLAIVRHLVELHGGTVSAQSPGVGKGATFTLKLPLSSSSQTFPDARKTDEAPSLNGIRILVIDDDQSTRDFFSFVLEQSGAVVTTANSAAEALNLPSRCEFDILLSDIGMPEMDGYSFIRLIKSGSTDFDARIPAIAISAYAAQTDRQLAIEAGFDCHISKPANPVELVTLVARLCKR